jgi:hypothetical protein
MTVSTRRATCHLPKTDVAITRLHNPLLLNLFPNAVATCHQNWPHVTCHSSLCTKFVGFIFLHARSGYES